MGGLRFRILIVSIVICIYVVSPGAPRRLRKGTRPKRQVCNTDVCKQKADAIKTLLDNATDPCDNFYDYVCKKWKQQHPIPADKSAYGTFTQLRMDLQQELKDILGNATQDFQQTEAPNITDKTVAVYMSCMNNRTEATSVEALREVMREVGIPMWPVSSDHVNTPDWNSTFIRLMKKLGLTPILNLNVAQDPKDVTKYVLQMDQHGFGAVGRNQFLNQTDQHNCKIIKAYKEYIREITKLVTGAGKKFTTYLSDFADTIVNFEVELAKITRPEEERRDYHTMYEKVTIRDLQEKVPQLSWLQFFNAVLDSVNITINEEEPVVVWEMGYYQKVLSFLSTVDRSTLHNYFGLQVVLSFGPDCGGKFEKLQLEFKKAVSGVTKLEERWKRCITDLQHFLDLPLGRMYVEKMFSHDAKKQTETMVTEMKTTFHELIKNKTWMDSETKTEALKKVESMADKIGYADWLMNDTYLEEKYKHVKNLKPDTPYVTVGANLLENVALRSLGRLHTYYNKTKEWYAGPAVVNAFYNPGSNDISFPAAILQPPFYKYGLPLSINMGGVGMVIGHEITHAFDDTGSQFDASGKLHNWWSESTKAEFKKRAQCFIEQFGNITDNQTSLLLNGINTQGENVADSGGLLGAYLTYKRLSQLPKKKKKEVYPDLALPGLENLTGDQMFFISNAIVWCTNIRDEKLRHLIQYDPHSPPKYRINVPMSNMDEFSEAFQCNGQKSMNPPNKCRVW